MKRNLIRKFFMIAVLVFGAANGIYADGGGTIGSGTRAGYLGSGNRAQAAPTRVEAVEPTAFDFILDAFYKLIF